MDENRGDINSMKFLYKVLIHHRNLLIFVPIIVILFIININSQIQATTRLVILAQTVTSKITKNEKNIDAFIYDLNYVIKMLLLNYTVASLIDYIKGLATTLIYKSLLIESLKHTFKVDYNELQSSDSSSLKEKTLNSCEGIRDLTPVILFELPEEIVKTMYLLVSIFFILNTKAYLTFIFLTFSSFLLSFSIGKMTSKCEKNNYKLFCKSLLPFSDIFSNLDIIKSFDKEDFEILRFGSFIDKYCRSCNFLYYKQAWLFFAERISLFIPQIYILVYSYISDTKIWDIDDSNRIYIFNTCFETLKENFLNAKYDIFFIIKKVSVIQTDTSFSLNPIKESKLRQEFNTSIRFNSVDFSVGGHFLMKNQSFEIPKGTKCAITGTNGSGKTVFIKTLMKLIKSHGMIYIDDTLLSSISDGDIRKMISYAPQDSHIFNDSVLYNLKYSCQKDCEYIFDMCRKYELHDFFKSLKNGYQTQAGEGGKYLSGGQRQRINIMRCLLKNAPIIIMDEPTANIDKNSEETLIKKIMEINKEKTILMIIHNIELLKHFEKVLYFSSNNIKLLDNIDEAVNLLSN